MKNSFIIKGDICYSEGPNHLVTHTDGYVVCVDGISKGIYTDVPHAYQDLEVMDCTGQVIMPGLVDLHVHAPQYHFRGLGMDLELLDWLNTYTFPHEARYSDEAYARADYTHFVEELAKSATTRAVIFATLHVPGTIILMDYLEQTGLITYVGKVNMDRNGIPELEEQDAETSAKATVDWLEAIAGKYENTLPIITPRFIPSCTDELMDKLSKIRRDYDLPVQSHLSENPSEVAWVKDLVPSSRCYGDAYAMFDLFGNDAKTVMAHCVWSDAEEQALIKDRGVFIAHCPDSNTNLASGIAPLRQFLSDGQKIGLGSDVAGGSCLNMFQHMVEAIQSSKLRWRLVDDTLSPIGVEEAIYLATLGGGEFFGQVGSFKDGYEFDAIVIDDEEFRTDDLSLHQRVERIVYCADASHLTHKFVKGKQLF
ncbi:amidohydrolase family protein [Peptoniphilus equinus]|uniref:Amidohydrolase family protein n=1 Tax=Peptoniphilus equinus TaxID=3016343 RepID=A0ABY7QUB4_9FIRM|nr:amidohydrolase family protein [Peptoniphilus equinus]WBW49615.1 amidohydrolase family protein [Peptoniphilus equinus]